MKTLNIALCTPIHSTTVNGFTTSHKTMSYSSRHNLAQNDTPLTVVEVELWCQDDPFLPSRTIFLQHCGRY